MRRLIPIACLLVAVTAGCVGAPGRKQAESDPRKALERQILAGLEIELKKLFNEAGVQAEIRNEGDRLVAGFRTGGEGSQPLDSTADSTTPERNEFRMQVTIIERLDRWITGMGAGYEDTIRNENRVPIQGTGTLGLLVLEHYGRDIDFDFLKKLNSAIEDYAYKKE
jgi:hypothetical protein